MKLQHSFWCEAAGHAFRRVRERDPNCAMTYWGEAMALLVNPFAVTTAANLRSDRAALAEARRNGAKTEREAGFIDALRPDLNSATTQVLEKKAGNEIQPCL